MSEKTSKTPRGAPAGKVHASFYLPAELRKALKLAAVEDEISVTDLVERFIREGLARRKR